MNREYSSAFASYISALLATKRAAGYGYESAQFYLHAFDRYCCERGEIQSLSRKLVLKWAEARDSESAATHRTRISPIRELGKFMQSVGINDAFVLPSRLCRKVERSLPHFFTNQELTKFFSACDQQQPHSAMHARHLVLPVFFRFLYCCGVRTCEARTLRVEDVDLQAGRVQIRESKGHRSRTLPLPKDLVKLFKTYDTRASAIYPSRVYFFPTTRSQCYRRSSVGTVFRKIWEAAGLSAYEGKRARAYDFRHHFALTNLNRWIVAGTDVNSMLPYLCRYMGHASIKSTDYYLHLVPEFFPTFREKVELTQSLLPEVGGEDE